eukprot:jgi/Chlat1/8658/Chrsp87S08045
MSVAVAAVASGGDPEEEDQQLGLGDDSAVTEAGREVGRQAVWSVTSAKPGNGVHFLRDGSIETYWQSDGAQPHVVSAHFQQKTALVCLALYLDYKQDESYTPQRIAVRAGNCAGELKDITQVELNEPSGWVQISLCPTNSREYLRAYLVQVAVLSNHQNGRDTHIRQIKIFGPRQNIAWALGHPLQFVTSEYAQFATLR